MSDFENFERLRTLLANRSASDAWNAELCSLLKEAYDSDRVVYRELWEPYCWQHFESWNRPIKALRSIDELNEWREICPFALFSLDLFRRKIGVDGCKKLSSSGLLGNVYSLDLGGNELFDQGVEYLLRSKGLDNLRELSLRSNALTYGSCYRIAESASLKQLTHLNFGLNRIGEKGAEALGKASILRNLKSLNLNFCFVGDEGCRWMTTSKHLNKLEELHVADNELSDDGIGLIATSPSTSALRKLTVARNRAVTKGGYRALFYSEHVGGIEHLSAYDSEFEDDMCESLSYSPMFKNMKYLCLLHNRIQDKGFELLVSTPFASQLQTLLLSGNRIGCSGVRAMIRSPYLTKLELLDLDGNDLVSISECMEELSQATNLPLLKTIDVGSQEDLFGDTVNLALACSVHLPIEARRSVFEKIRIEKVRQEAEKHQVNIEPDWSKEEIFCAIWEKKQSRGQLEDDESYEASNLGRGEEGS